MTGLNSRTYEVFVIDSADCKSNLHQFYIPYVYNDCFFIPNAFTPNGDGINDIFIIDGLYSKTEVSLTIFNYFGEKIIAERELDLVRKANSAFNPVSQAKQHFTPEAYAEFKKRVKEKKDSITIYNPFIYLKITVFSFNNEGI